MITYHDTINSVSFIDVQTCEFHKKNPNKQHAGCTCSMSIGYRKATPEERLDNLKKSRAAIQEKIDDLELQKRMIDAEILNESKIY